MTAIVDFIRREPVRTAYIAVIAVIAGYAAAEQAIAQHPQTLLAAVPIFVTALGGEIARAKVTPVAKLLSSGGTTESALIQSFVADVLPPTASPQTADVLHLLPEAEMPPEAVRPVVQAAESAVATPDAAHIEALADALVPVLAKRLGITPPVAVGVASSGTGTTGSPGDVLPPTPEPQSGGDALDATMAEETQAQRPGQGA